MWISSNPADPTAPKLYVKRTAPDCHPDRPLLAKAMCKECYGKAWHLKNNPPKPRDRSIHCGHPERPFHARHMCEGCYKQWKRKHGRRASCHPDKPHVGQGKCGPCYQKDVCVPKRDPAKHRRMHKNADLKKKYGLTLKDYEAKVAACGNRCAICGGPPSGTGRAGILYVDHDHVTGAVRDLVCAKCNIMLGGARDRPETLEAGAAYIRRHSAA